MSGGHWQYAGFKIRDVLEEIRDDDRAQEKWPLTCRVLGALGEVIYTIEHEMDWDLSSDSKAKNTDLQMTGILLNAVLRELPDEWFPRGKWATIQVLQERSGRAHS